MEQQGNSIFIASNKCQSSEGEIALQNLLDPTLCRIVPSNEDGYDLPLDSNHDTILNQLDGISI
jgi:hypothetical protein